MSTTGARRNAGTSVGRVDLLQTLAGIRVADFTRWLSGPTLTMLLGDMGADVVKVESLPHGDPSREPGPFVGNESVYYLSANRSKRGLAVDLHREQGQEIVNRLVATADVVAQNFRPGVAEAIGLDYEKLRADNPRLVYCSISGFGLRPPGSNFPGFDQTAQAMSGMMSVTGTDATGPLRVGIPIADSSTGVFAALAVVSALFERERTGLGQRVDTSLMGSMLFLLTYQAQRYLSAGDVAGRDGNDHPMAYPQGTFAVRDGFITIATGNNKMWANLCEVLGLSELIHDPRFVDNAARMRHRRELRGLMESRLAAKGSAEWIPLIAEVGIPCGPVLDIKEALEHPITAGLGTVQEIDHPTIGNLRVVGPPMTFGGNQHRLARPPPLFGEHSLEVCRELGFTDDEIGHLLSVGIIRVPGPTDAMGA